MAKFTLEEASGCTITRAEQVSKDDVHQYWVFGVTDAEGNYCDWKDTETAEGASDATQKTAISDYLVGNCEKKVAKPVIVNTNNDTIIGGFVG